MRKTALMAIAGLLGFALAPSAAYADPGDTMQGSGTASATVVDSLQITRITNLRFGRFASPTTTSSLRVSMTGAITPSADIASSINMPQPPDGRGPAQFRIELDGNRGFTAYVPPTITITNGAASMLINNWEGRLVRIVNAGRNSVYRLDYGGTLRINPNQAPGQYRGNFTVTVVYN